MKQIFSFGRNKLSLTILTLFLCSSSLIAQPFCEWRLANSTFDPTDPDGGGPAVGTVSFTLQIRTIAPGSVTQPITAISTGYIYQSANAAIPTGVLCTQTSPANIVLSPAMLAGGFVYSTVNQCGTIADLNLGGQVFNRRAVGTLVGPTGIIVTNAWADMFTVTLWALNPNPPQGGYAAINSSAGGSPGAFGTYALADDALNEYITNSLTYTTPLPLPAAPAPVLFSQFKATCSPNGTLINWKTAQESNSSYFEVERSVDGNTWVSLGRTAAAGNSSTDRSYNQIDLEAGNAMYRVKQVDKDGQFIYTGIERANCQVKNITSVIYPVPAQSELNVVIKSDRALNTQLVIFDATGRAVRRENVNIQNGSNNFKINLNGLSSGEYLLKSTNVELDLRKQFSIIR